jgi:uncharacterized membrane protein YedE/YeeE
MGGALGLVVVGLLATLSARIGVVGGFSEWVERATGRAPRFTWKAWFAFGVGGGALLFRLVRGASSVHGGFGWLTRTFHSDPLVAALLLAGGVLIGFGAKLAGGCTSGNGLGGCSVGSPASLAATGTFMATAVAISFVIRWLT